MYFENNRFSERENRVILDSATVTPAFTQIDLFFHPLHMHLDHREQDDFLSARSISVLDAKPLR